MCGKAETHLVLAKYLNKNAHKLWEKAKCDVLKS